MRARSLVLTGALLAVVGAVHADDNAGKTVYQGTCIACHGPDGKGVLPGVPDFTAPNSPLNQKDEVLIKHITEGFQAPDSPMAMPARGGNPSLTDAQISEALAYIRKTFKP